MVGATAKNIFLKYLSEIIAKVQCVISERSVETFSLEY